MSQLPLVPAQASTVANDVDALYLFLVLVSAFFAVLIATLIVYFAIKYRRRDPLSVGARITGSVPLELLWTVIPLGISMVIFVWGASLFYRIARPPKDALDVYVVGKRWMWKVQHPDGQREINQLHVPIGRPVRLTMGSEDVIHSFYIPAFRVKWDVIPGRTTTAWFEATKTGEFHLFCAEYCGTKHSAMIGSVVVMEPADFQAWLGGGRGSGDSLADAGGKLFQSLGCASCHSGGPQAQGPVLQGLFGKQVKLADGSTVTADENYIRESIMNPQARLVAGFAPIMPPYQGQINEEGLLQLIAYVRSLGQPQGQ